MLQDLIGVAAIVYQLIIWRSDVHHAPRDLVLQIAHCENPRSDPTANLTTGGPYGIGQWEPGQAAWRRTPAYTTAGIAIDHSYIQGDENALYFDIDQLAWAFSPEAPSDLKYEWACYHG